MASRSMVEEFMAQRNLALVRGSRSAKVHGFSIDTELAARGYTVTVVHLDESGAVASLKERGSPLEGAILAVPAAQCEQAVRMVADAGIKRVWMQTGSESKAAIALCKEKGVAAVHGECVMMFAAPVKSVHAFHRFIWKVLGLLPR